MFIAYLFYSFISFIHQTLLSDAFVTGALGGVDVSPSGSGFKTSLRSQQMSLNRKS